VRRLASALAIGVCLLLAGPTPGRSIPIPHCPPTVEGHYGGTIFMCFLTAIAVDASGGYECYYGDCITNYN